MVKRSSGPISRGPEGDRVAVKVGVQMGRVNAQMGDGHTDWASNYLKHGLNNLRFKLGNVVEGPYVSTQLLTSFWIKVLF